MSKIGHASISENGTVKGKAGDQTGKEVCVRTWYNKPWVAVYRAQEPYREKIAKNMEKCCKNNHIGYSQYSRLTLYDQAVTKGKDFSKITTDCNCDCSSLVGTILVKMGWLLNVASFTTSTADATLRKLGFEKLTASRYLTSPNNLVRGDILLARGHIAVYLGD